MPRATTAILASSCLLAAIPIAAATAEGKSPPRLLGIVTSQEEGPMEGVLVSAQAPGSPITITVVSDAKGNYAFPGNKIGPGRYAVRIRAAGYDLEGPAAVLVADRPDTQHIRLRKTVDLAAQLSNAEWMASMPGTPQEKRQLLNCLGCHTLERVARSKYTSEEFLAAVLPRMQAYVNQSIPGAAQMRKGERLMEERGDQRVQVYKDLGDYLAKVNLSRAPAWSYELKTFPRPAGAATHVVYTEYDLPDKLAQPHDVVIDRKGQAWYSSFGMQKIGRVDPVTGAVKEYDIAISKPDYPTGVLALRGDRDGNLWLGNMYQASIAKFDVATEKFQHFTPPPEDNLSSTQLNMVAPWNSGVDGKVWSQNNGFAGVHRFDLATGKGETWAPFKDSKEPHNIYDVISDSQNNAFFTDFRQQHIGRIDAKTGVVTLYETPTTSACSTRRPASSANGRCRRPTPRPTTWCSTRTNTPGPDR